jgi:hypothetical protein
MLKNKKLKKEEFIRWLKAYEQPDNIKLLKAIELDEWLNSGCNEEVTRRSLKQTVRIKLTGTCGIN